MGNNLETTLKDIFLDIDHLSKISNADFENEFWDNYIQYIENYNSILKKLQEIGFFKELSPIAFVPDAQRAYMHYGFSSAEQAKLREVANSSKLLRAKVKEKLPKEKSKKNGRKPLRQNRAPLQSFPHSSLSVKKKTRKPSNDRY